MWARIAKNRAVRPAEALFLILKVRPALTLPKPCSCWPWGAEHLQLLCVIPIPTERQYTSLATALCMALEEFGGPTWVGEGAERCAGLYWCVKVGFALCSTLVSCSIAL